MSRYTPLFDSLVMSSIWDEDNETRILWITMLALANSEGIIEGSLTGLAHSARLTIESCQKALEKLKSPDPYSRTKQDEGRRIKEVEGGWLVLNHKKYREKAKSRAAYYREWRQKKKESKEENSKNLNKNLNVNLNSATTRNNQSVAQHVAHYFTLQDVKDACIANGIPETNAQSYFDHYNSQGFRKGNGQLITNLQSHTAKRWNRAEKCWDFDQGRMNQSNSVADQVRKFKDEGKL